MTSNDRSLTGAVEPRRRRARLHPLTPLLRSARMLTLVVVAVSWQGYAQLGPSRWVLVMALVLVGALAFSALSWLVTGYEIIGRELRVWEGVLFRRTRAVPLERLQAVDVVRPMLARLTGLAELRLEVIGAHKTEAPLAFLTIRQATELRERLLRLAGAVPREAAADIARPAHPRQPTRLETPAGTVTVADPVTGAVAAPAAAPERLLHAVSNRDVLVGQLLTPQAWSIPIALLVTAVPFALSPMWTFIGVASTLTALAGVLLQPARRVLSDWNFQILSGPPGLRLSHGLLETRSQTVPLTRVQAIGVIWPLLWRPCHWLRTRIDIAGYAAHGREGGPHVDHLLPVAGPDIARALIAEVLPGVDVAALGLTRPPSRARALAPLRQPYLGVYLSDRVVATMDHWLTRQLVLVPYARIQSVRVVANPLQRMLRLASVHVDTAGSLPAVAHHRDRAEAYALAGELIVRARMARGADPSPPPVP